LSGIFPKKDSLPAGRQARFACGNDCQQRPHAELFGETKEIKKPLPRLLCNGKGKYKELKGQEMNSIERIQQEYQTASGKKQELAERLRNLEETEPNNFHQLWIMRDQIAYWEGKSEGLQFALQELNKGGK
jgi:hypothetical protein